MNRSGIAGGLLLAVACAGGAYLQFQLRPVWRVETAVKAQLKDPESAQFTSLTFNPSNGIACGYVNAKNSMGGYTGPRHFMVIDTFAILDQEFELPADADQQYQTDMAKVKADYQEHVKKQCFGTGSPPKP